MKIWISILGLLFCAGCAGSGASISTWQRGVEQYVKEQGKGDPAVLSDVKLRDGRRGFAVIGAPVPSESSDANGVLLGHRVIDGKPWFIYLVGLVQNQRVQDIRLAAVSENAGKFDWKIGGKDQAALQAYQKYNESLWRQRFPGRRDAPADYSGFPSPEDQFDLSVEPRQIQVVHRAAQARWTLAL